MATAKKLENLYAKEQSKDNSSQYKKEINDLQKNIEELLKDPAKQKKAALIISQLINSNTK